MIYKMKTKLQFASLALAFSCLSFGTLASAQTAPATATAKPANEQYKAQEAAIRKNLATRINDFKNIDEITPTDISGVFEIRIGTEIFYSDATGDYLFMGQLMNTKAQRNLTEERIQKLTAIDFSTLPLQDAFTIVRGKGERKLVVFEDPNCGYCKRFERELQSVDNVTIHVFLYPILGPSSTEISNNIWCAKDKVKTWEDYMIREVAVPAASCDTSAVARNVELGRKYKITGTPTLIFANGSRIPGAAPAAQIEQMLDKNK